jgi:putative PIN family toxin of toxin-antitoxin system
MRPPRVVLDTNVVVAGLRSRRGASFRLLSALGRGKFEVPISVPLLLEYEEVLLRDRPPGLAGEDIQIVLDYICSVARHQEIFYLWRPILPDPQDDLVLEVAVAAGCSAIITHNRRDFAGAARFGIRILTPAAFLKQIGVLP